MRLNDTLKTMDKADLYIAASLEGFISDVHGGTDWVMDDELFEKTCSAYGCVCMGKKTFDEYKTPPFEGMEFIVLTHKIPKKSKFDSVHYVNTPQKALECAKNLGFKELLVIGGAKTNQSFMQAGLVHRVMVDIHPILLGAGAQMFGDFKAKFDFKMIRNKWYKEGFTHAEYTVGDVVPSKIFVIVRNGDGKYFMHRNGKEWSFGVSADQKDNEDSLFAAKDMLRQQIGIKNLPEMRTEFRPSTDPHIFVTIYEVISDKIRKIDPRWDEIDWIDGVRVNELVDEGKLELLPAEIFKQYRQSLSV